MWLLSSFGFLTLSFGHLLKLLFFFTTTSKSLSEIRAVNCNVEKIFSKKIKRLKEIKLEKLQQYRRHVDTEIPSSNINKKKNVLVEPTDRLPHLSCNLGKSLNSNSEWKKGGPIKRVLCNDPIYNHFMQLYSND